MSISYGGDYITDTDGGKLKPSSSVMRNRIINGAMMIDQRNAGASVTPSADGYLLDRWSYYASQASKFTFQQNKGSVTPPVGFSNYFGMSVASAVTSGASDYFLLQQPIEGFNVADLNWGTANAKTVTLSFQVYSSLTGQFGGALCNSGFARSYPFSYTISSANTWTTVSVTIAGDTSGTWLTNNGVGIYVVFDLGCGATYLGTTGSWAGSSLRGATGDTKVVGTNGATFYITGVQLEVGSSATGYEYRQYGQELALCQRYAFTPDLSKNTYIGVVNAAQSWLASVIFPTTMRTAPTMTISGSFSADNGIVVQSYSSGNISLNNAGTGSARMYFTSGSGLAFTAGQAANTNSGTTGSVTFSAEL